jgi:hypothetical protein
MIVPSSPDLVAGGLFEVWIGKHDPLHRLDQNDIRVDLIKGLDQGEKRYWVRKSALERLEESD